MTNTYKTLNPLGSTSAKDLSDNASNFDEGMNSLSPSFYDRFKRRRETWAGMEKMVSDFLEAMGFEATHLVYVDGSPLTVLRPTQLIDRAGSVYKVKAPATFPVMLTGTWATDALILVDVGDAALRDDLANTADLSKGASMIPTTARVVNSIADLAAITPESQTVFVLGYNGPGTRGGGHYRPNPAGNPLDENGGTKIAGASGLWEFVGEWTAATFGVTGDGDLLGGGTDDTAAINRAIAATPPTGRLNFEPGMVCNITSLNLSGLDFSIDFKGATLYGNSTVVTGPLVTLTDFSTHKIFDLKLRTDGNRTTPIYHGNYTCAIRLVSTGGASATQFLTIDGLKIWYFRQGMVNGNYVGESPQASATQSEIWISDFQVRGVNRPYHGNLINSYVVFENSGIIPQKFESSSAWWVDADGWCARNDDPRSTVMFLACEFQRAITPGFALYGQKITVVDPVWEVSCPCYVAGDMTLRGGIDNYFGVAAVVAFQVAPSATGVLLLDGFNLERPAGTANFDRARLVDASGNNNYRISLDNCRFKEWSFEAPNGAGDFVHGGRFWYDNLFLDNSGGTATSFELRSAPNAIGNVDRSGNSMVASSTTTTGGWTVYTGAANGAFGSNTTSPPGSSSTMIIMTTNAGGTFGIASPTASGQRIPVQGDRDYVVDMWLRAGAIAAGSSFQVLIDWYDYAGSAVGTSTLASLDSSTYTQFTSNLRYRGATHAPWSASSGVIRINLGPNSTIRFSDISLS